MKTAELLLKYATNQSKSDSKDKLLGAGAIGLGANTLLHPAFKKNITGRETFYHGTNPENVEVIKQEGLRPSASRGSTDILEHINPQAAAESRNMSFVTPNKVMAREYAVKEHDLAPLQKSQAATPLSSAQARSAWQQRAVVDPSIQSRVVNPFNNKGIVETSLPTWKEEIASKIKTNPEVAMGKEQWKNNFSKIQPHTPDIQKNIIFDVLNQSKGVEGGVAPEFIKGSPKYKGLSLGEMGQYIKAKPGRFAKGLGLGALGIGGIGYGAKKLYDSYSKEASLAVAGLENLGLGILAKPGIDTLRNPNASPEEKSHAKFETAGLGVLAAHPTYELAQAAKSGIKNKIPDMLESTSPTVRQIGQGLQSFAPKVQSMLGKVRPMLKLGHSAFYRNMLKED